MEGGVIDHPLNELGIHLDDELLNSDRIKLSMLQGAEESIEFELRLRVVRLAGVERNRPETTRVSLLTLSKLEEDVANAVRTRIDRKNNWMLRLVVDRMQSRRAGDQVLQLSNRLELRGPDLEGDILSGEINKGSSN